jgi:hypothetical protein
MPKRKHFSASQKAQIALEILKEEKNGQPVSIIGRECATSFRQ